MRREHLTSCLKEPAAASSFTRRLPDWRTCAVRSVGTSQRSLYSMLGHFCTWCPQSHYCPGLRVSLADQIFRPHVCLLSSSLCLGGAHLWRPPLAHTPGVIRCHGSAWLPEPLFKMAAQHSSLLDRWATPTSWTCSVPWTLWHGMAWRWVKRERECLKRSKERSAEREWSVFPGPVSHRFYSGSLLLLSICYDVISYDVIVTGPIRGVNPEDDSTEFLTRMWSFICHMSPVSIINYIKLEIHYLFNVLN